MNFPTVVYLDKFLDYCRKYLSVENIDKADHWAVLIGGWAVYVATVFLFIAGLIMGINSGDVTIILIAIAVLPIGVLMQYAAIKMLDAIDRAGDSGDQREEVVEAMIATENFDSPIGRFSIDANGDTSLNRIAGYKIRNRQPSFAANLRGERAAVKPPP